MDLTCIDELCYMELGKRGAELSIIFQLDPDVQRLETLRGAIVDRLALGGAITDSYRLAQTRAAAPTAS